MKATPILDELINFKNKKYTKFFMPSHLQLQYNEDYSDTQKEVFSILKNFEKDIFSLDVTEVNDFDNLSNPTGIIKKSQDILADSFNAKKAYFLVNGSTVGVLSMISAIVEDEDSVIIQKNSHKSIYNACNIKKLNVIYIECGKNEEFDIYDRIDTGKLEILLQTNKDVKAVIIASSDYYGQNQDVKKIADICHLYGTYLLLDCAHCANYNYSDLFDEFPIKYADIAVTSFHKTLPSINQTAILTVNKKISDDVCDKIRENINIFQTTSPSYILLSNIELVDNIMSKYGKKLYDELYKKISYFKERVSKLNKTTKNMINILKNDDFSRLVISLDNINIDEVYEFLKQNMILVEMANEKSIVLICNVFHTYSDFEKLFDILEKLVTLKESNISEKNYAIISEKQLYKEEILSYLQKNINKKSNKTIYLYPPGTPLIVKNDIIENNHIEKVIEVINNVFIDIIL